MKLNMGGIDRALRVVAGLGLIAWVALFGGPVWAWFGVWPVATGLLGYCPVYPLIGLNTCSTNKN